MKLITVGTGSSGNCYLLQMDNDRFIALDCGCKWRSVMIATGFKPTAIDFALVTHSHGDHSGYIKDFRKNGIDVYTPEDLLPKKPKKLGSITVVPFEVPHDVKCYGYLIKADGHTIVYMTDFGYCKYTFKSWAVDTWLIACNHTELPDIDSAKYAHVVTGHSSLETVIDILATNKCESMKNVILCHYNEFEDTDMMARDVQATVGREVYVSVAKKGANIHL